MIAVDESADSVDAARSATALFGEEAQYLVVNVARSVLPMGMTPWAFPSEVVPWGFVVQYQPDFAGSYMAPTTTSAVAATEASEDMAASDAASIAAKVATEADVEHAEVVGATGDPAGAIVAAAHEHHADVIVIGSHDRSWFHRLFAGSVRDDVLRQADIPVLVMK